MRTISALMPTHDRREFIPRSIRCFLAQQYPADWDVELVVLDDGSDPIKDLIPEDPRIKYFQELPKRNHGQKMNRCMELGRGEFCIVWDDDDWYASDRLVRQIEPLIQHPNFQVSGTAQIYYYVHGTQDAYRYVNLTNLTWLAAIAFPRAVWDAFKFNDKSHGADFDLMHNVPHSQWCTLTDPRIMVSAIHVANASPKRLPNPSFVAVPWLEIQAITKGEL
jgi:glycosyltransferase involved in cell wall biosynthesis